MSAKEKISFKMISFMHETLYGIFRDPVSTLESAGLAQGQSVLEIGCGPGFFTIPAARIVGNQGSVLSIDVNSVAIAHVKEKIAQSGLDNVRAERLNASDTGLPDSSIDLAFVFGLPRAEGGFEPLWKEVKRVLRPGGILSVEGRQQPPGEMFRPDTRAGRITRYRKD